MWKGHQLFAAFVALVGMGMAIAAGFLTAPSTQDAAASTADNVRGWVWADPIGWISLNDLNSGAGGGTYGVNIDPSTGVMNGFAWSENAGWICFGDSCSHPDCTGPVPPSVPAYSTRTAKMDPPPYAVGGSIRNLHGWAKVCNEGSDGWISLNCADVSPSACGSYGYRVAFDMTTHMFEDASGGGSPLNGASFAWNGNTDGTGFGYIDFHNAYLSLPNEDTDVLCADGLDNDVDAAVDCADSSCSVAPVCVPPQDLVEDQCPLGTPELCCSDNTDNEGDGAADCDDTDCQGVASMCTVAWLRTKFGNVYAQKGIEAIAAPASQFNASYCLSLSDGSIAGFASEAGCVTTSSQLNLPTASTGYRGTLGSIDIAGIENGRYGPVRVIADGAALPSMLDGGVYLYDAAGGVVTISAKTFENGIGSTGRGNGLLYIKGGDLVIAGDLTYSSPSVQNYLRNLASFGVIVTKDASGNGGRIVISPSVHTIVGAYFAEDSISTGATTELLTVYGLLASRQLALERTGGTSSTAAETVIFDGRAVANPPPGMQDIGKSLPTAKDAF
jgi:hypothetical protein